MTDLKNLQSCPSCGDSAQTQRNSIALPLRSILNNRFLVGRVLGKPGGFGVTYLAWDMLLETTAAIKEFLPLSTVSRELGKTTVRANSEHDQAFFKQGLQIFLKEAKTLAQFSHPNIIRIRDCFSANNTAYLVMDYHQGQTLDQMVRSSVAGLTEEQSLQVMLPILDGLEYMHNKGFLHRDIKPQNIYIADDQTPLLLDFGASRFTMVDTTQTLTVMLSAGYAPFEQYHQKGKQGFWSDIYSVAATLYFMTTGKLPTDAIERQQNDQINSLVNLNPLLSHSFSRAIMQALSVNPRLRPQTVAIFRHLLTGIADQTPTIDQSAITATHKQSEPAIKPSNKPSVIIQYKKQNKRHSFWVILILLGLFIALWSNRNDQNNIDHITNSISAIDQQPILENENFESVEEDFNDDFIEFETSDFEINSDQAFLDLPEPSNPVSVQAKRPPRPFPTDTNCQNKTAHSSCTFQTPRGKQYGICLPVQPSGLACLPHHRPPHPPPPPPGFRR